MRLWSPAPRGHRGRDLGEPLAAMSAVAARVLTSPRLVKLALSPQVQAAAQELDRGTLTHGQRALLGLGGDAGRCARGRGAKGGDFQLDLFTARRWPLRVRRRRRTCPAVQRGRLNAKLTPEERSRPAADRKSVV